MMMGCEVVGGTLAMESVKQYIGYVIQMIFTPLALFRLMYTALEGVLFRIIS